MRVTALASGSSGNAFLFQAGETAFLVDAGISLAALTRALACRDVAPERLACVLLTHEHCDHLASAGALSRRYGLPLLATEGTLGGLKRPGGERVRLVPGDSTSIGAPTITPFAVPHDSAEPVGYLIEHEGVRVGLATDMGHVPQELLAVFRACDLLILEANHDEGRLWRGPYPRVLKERVAAATGHLSNDQTAECLVACASGAPQWVWLAHLSEVNNSPTRALRTVTERLRRENIGSMQVQVALRDRPSLTWDSHQTYFQSRLF